MGLAVLCTGSAQLPQIPFAKSPEGRLFVHRDWTWDLGLDSFYYIFSIMCAVTKIAVSF